MANVKFIAVSRGLRGIVDYVTNRGKTVEQRPNLEYSNVLLHHQISSVDRNL